MDNFNEDLEFVCINCLLYYEIMCFIKNVISSDRYRLWGNFEVMGLYICCLFVQTLCFGIVPIEILNLVIKKGNSTASVVNRTTFLDKRALNIVSTTHKES